MTVRRILVVFFLLVAFLGAPVTAASGGEEGLALSVVVFFGGIFLAVAVVCNPARAPHSTDQAERAADRALAESYRK